MDPVSCLGLISSAITFVDFLSKIISKANEIRERGSTEDVEQLKTHTRQLIGYNAGLRYRARNLSVFDRSGRIDSIEKQLDGLTSKCGGVADEMISLLDKVTTNKVKPGLPDVLKQVFRTLLKKDELEKMSKKLDGYRAEFNQFILLLINEKIEQGFADTRSQYVDLADGQSQIQVGQRKILEIVSFTQGTSQEARLEDISDLERRVLHHQAQCLAGREIEDEDRESPKDTNDIRKLLPDLQGQKPIAITVTRKDGTTETINLGGSKYVKGKERRHFGLIETATFFRGVAGNDRDGEVSITDYRSLAQTVLDTLYFPVVQDREEGIPNAHKRTFEWIFKPERDFVKFLKDETGCYWVTGKPGSGKSTLMKFIVSQTKTRQMLEEWAGDELAIASFFFWHAGTVLQKSHEGLVRTLLRAILCQREDLIPTAFPSLCRTYLNTGAVDMKMVTFSELSLALGRLLNRKDAELKTCMFIDGLDEFAGDPQEMCKIIKDLASSPSIKMVISSRPLNDFENNFEAFPKIRMQDVTRSDINRFVSDKLQEETVLKQLQRKGNEHIIPDLVTEISDKSDGVFLWVIFVVKSLVSGINNWDEPEDLRRRLNDLPPTLEELYQHLFKSVEPIYHDRTSRFLRIFQRSTELQAYGPMSVLQLHYASKVTLRTAITPNWKPLQAKKRNEISEEVDKHLRASTFGLLEVYTPPTSRFTGSSSMDQYVRCLHKSVLDFLRQEDISTFLKTYESSSNPLDLDLSLLASSIEEIKVLPFERAVILDSDRVMTNMRNIFSIMRCIEASRRRPFTKELDYLDRLLSSGWENAEKCKAQARHEAWIPTRGSTWSAFASDHLYQTVIPDLPLLGSTTLPPFITLATLSGCVLYVADKVTNSGGISSGDRTMILGHLISQFFVESWKKDSSEAATRPGVDFNFVTAIQKLLDQKMDPNATTTIPIDDNLTAGLFRSQQNPSEDSFAVHVSPWECCLVHILGAIGVESSNPPDFYHGVRTVPRAVQCLQIIQSFVRAGAQTHSPLRRVASAFPEIKYPASVSLQQILMWLKDAVSKPDTRTFEVDLQSGEIEQFELELRRTIDLLHLQWSTWFAAQGIKGLQRRLHITDELLLGFLAGVFSIFLMLYTYLGV